MYHPNLSYQHDIFYIFNQLKHIPSKALVAWLVHPFTFQSTLCGHIDVHCIDTSDSNVGWAHTGTPQQFACQETMALFHGKQAGEEH